MMKKLSLLSIFMLLTACGGGGGGGALVDNTPANPNPSNPTYTYTKIDELRGNDLRPQKVLVRALVQRGGNNTDFRTSFEYKDGTHKVSFVNEEVTVAGQGVTTINGIELRYAVNFAPQLGGDYGADYSSYIYETQTCPNSSCNSTTEYKPFTRDNYQLFYHFDDSTQVGNSNPEAAVTTLGFTSKNTKGTEYVGQLIQWVNYFGVCCSNYDFVGFVFGDPTQVDDIPSSGSAAYDVTAQVLARGHYGNSFYLSTYYGLGQGTFNADFASRSITGELFFNSLTDSIKSRLGNTNSITWIPVSSQKFNNFKFSGAISGSDFSGDVVWRGEDFGSKGEFNGSFFGPDASELGGVFNVTKTPGDGSPSNNEFWAMTGTFTGCTTC